MTSLTNIFDLNPISANVLTSLQLVLRCAKLHSLQISITDLKLVIFFVITVIMGSEVLLIASGVPE